MLFVNPSDLIGKTFHIISQEYCQQSHARIVKIIKNLAEQLGYNPTLIKFKLSINNYQFEEVITYNDLKAYIKKIMTTRSYGSSRKSLHMMAH